MISSMVNCARVRLLHCCICGNSQLVLLKLRQDILFVLFEDGEPTDNSSGHSMIEEPTNDWLLLQRHINVWNTTSRAGPNIKTRNTAAIVTENLGKAVLSAGIL